MSDVAREIWKNYERGQEFNRKINLYDTVENNQNFVLGKQWEGLNVSTLDPLIFNVLRRVVNVFVSIVVSDDVTAQIMPMNRTTENEEKLTVVDAYLKNIIEQSHVKKLNRYMIYDACVNGDSAFYMYYDRDLDDISVDLIDNTNIFFGNTASSDVQKQPYIIICMRRDANEVTEEFHKNGGDENIQILSDYNEDSYIYEDDGKVTVLLKMWKKDGKVNFIKTTRQHVIMPEVKSDYKIYPISYMSWNRVKNSYHGASPITEAIPNQIAINKLYSMYMQCMKHQAFPKIIYDMTRFPNGYTNDVGKAIGMRGNPNEAILTAFKPPEISSQVMALLKQMIAHTMELLGTSDATLGNVNPDNTSAIIAVQQATSAPLELVRMEFFRFVEDYVRVFLELMRSHFGVKSVYTEDGQKKITFDFSTLSEMQTTLNVEIGASAYWSESLQTMTNDNLMKQGIITDPVLYVENIPSNLIKGKSKILKSLKTTKKEDIKSESKSKK